MRTFGPMRLPFADWKPRRSLAAALGLSLASLSLVGAVIASVWVGALTRARIETQIGAIFAQYATQVSNELDINLNAKLQTVQAAAAIYGRLELDRAPPERARQLLAELHQALPELAWIAFADPAGQIAVASGRVLDPGVRDRRDWLEHGLKGPWLGGLQRVGPGAAHAGSAEAASFVLLSAPVPAADSTPRGALVAQLSWAWARALGTALTETLHARRAVQTLLIDRDGMVLLGPEPLVGQRIGMQPGARDRTVATTGQTVAAWPDGRTYLAGYAISDGFGLVPSLGWTVWVREPADDAFASARRQQWRVFGAIVLLGVLTAAAAVVAARRLTRELSAIARSADEIRAGRRTALEVPAGHDEAARIGQSMQALLDELRGRSAALQQLNAELDARVAARTREVERMAEENRHAAVVRERLRLARDLHDTLAHTIMAVLTEIRLMRKLLDGNPAALPDELARAEAIAHGGLAEARAAIGQLRLNVVRDVGLGAALRELAARFETRSGAAVAYTGAPEFEQLADSRAEVLFRIAEEALRNVERHAGATYASVWLGHADDALGARLRLAVVDDGIGFDASRAPPHGHFGLRGMAEQAELIGAQLAVRSHPGEGTRVELTLRY